MKYTKKKYEDVIVERSVFEKENCATETHAMIHLADSSLLFDEQLERLHKALQIFGEEVAGDIVMARYFLSDSANQEALVLASSPLKCAFSCVQQPPFGEGKVALWLWCSEEGENYKHIRRAEERVAEGDSYSQTRVLLERYEKFLEGEGLNIADNCVRTWFFARDVDVNYHGIVVGRRENFETQGLTEKTHYITSTGIQGANADYNAKVLLDTYAIGGLQEGQVKYLYAPTHLNPTYEYGVTFERGVRIIYGDRSLAMISGTASINNKGEVVHVGNIEKQTLRMLENVKVLLNEAGMDFENMAHAIVYLRDLADFPLVAKIFDESLPNVPRVVTLAPVCRPTWLIEMECMAVKAEDNPQFKKL